jgi:hypothetical protein
MVEIEVDSIGRGVYLSVANRNKESLTDYSRSVGV